MVIHHGGVLLSCAGGAVAYYGAQSPIHRACRHHALLAYHAPHTRSAWYAGQLYLVVEVIWNTDHHHILGKEQHRLDGQRSLVVQKVLPPAIGDELGQNDGEYIIFVAP